MALVLFTLPVFSNAKESNRKAIPKYCDTIDNERKKEPSKIKIKKGRHATLENL